MKNRKLIQKADIEIIQADSSPIKIKGMMKLLVRIGETKSVQKFYITPDLCTEVILGEDWLHCHEARV